MTIDDAVAITIWWCEGAKLRQDYRWKNSVLYPIEVTNTDPRIVSRFCVFLRRLGVPKEKIRGQLHIHEGDDQDKLERFWSTATDIPLSQFNKTIIRKNGTRRGKSIGTFKLRTYSKQVFVQLLTLQSQMLGEPPPQLPLQKTAFSQYNNLLTPYGE